MQKKPGHCFGLLSRYQTGCHHSLALLAIHRKIYKHLCEKLKVRYLASLSSPIPFDFSCDQGMAVARGLFFSFATSFSWKIPWSFAVTSIL